MNKNTYFVWPLGCQTNKSDGERVAAVLEKQGYSRVENEEDAGVIAVIACAIRQSAVDRIYGKFRSWETRQQNGDLTTMLTGCVLPHDKKALGPKFDIVFEIEELTKLPLYLMQSSMEVTAEYVDDKKAEHTRVVSDGFSENQTKVDKAREDMSYFDVKPIENTKFRAWVPIMKGCDKFCTYCAVPYTRGRERSRSSADILREVKEYVDKGYKDIHLLGQNVNTFGMDKNKEEAGSELNFAELLAAVAEIEGDFWVRFHAPHPAHFGQDVIDVIATYDKLCNQINLPAQSGSSAVLRRMNRPYTREQYIAITDAIQATIPGVSLSTDIITGFSGETLEQHLETKSLMEHVGYDMAYIAKYSVRPGTVAARRFDDDVTNEEKKRREVELDQVLRRTFQVNQDKKIGQTVKVLVEKYSKDHWLARDEHQVTIQFSAPEDANLEGTFQMVHLDSVKPFRFLGTLV